MQVEVARISSVLMELAVSVPADAVNAEVEKAYSSLQRKAHVRGFRPGKAPRQVLARLYGQQVTSDVVNTLVTQTLPKALNENKVQPVNQPHVEPGPLERGSAFQYKARFEVTPDIQDVAYEGLELVRPSTVATGQMVDEQIEVLRRSHARLEAPEPPRPARKGDVVTVDFTIDVEGQRLKDAGGEGVSLEVGSGQALPELEAALDGKQADDAFDVEAKFPERHPRPELKGKTATFHVKIKDVKERILPALDDEFAKDVGSFQTLVELRADVHTRLEKMLKDRAETALAEQVIEKLNEKNALAVPPSLVEQQCKMMETEFAQNARRMGRRFSQEEFAEVHGQVHAEAEKKVRAGLLMAAIARKLGVQVGDADIQQGIQELAAETGKNVAKVRAEYGDPQRRQILVGMILEDKVLDLIESKATIREGEASEETTSTPASASASGGASPGAGVPSQP